MVKEHPAHYLGHRTRLRDRLDHDPRGLSEHEVLELLLTYALPRKDTKPIAKEMIARFGSLGDALLADPARIAAIPGLGQGAATFWRTLHECRARTACGSIARRENSPRRSRSGTWSAPGWGI